MDYIEILEADHGVEICELLTIIEAEALLRDDGEDTSNPDPDSPTAAVKSIIAAQIAKNLVTLTTDAKRHSKTDSNKNTFANSTPYPAQQAIPKKVVQKLIFKV